MKILLKLAVILLLFVANSCQEEILLNEKNDTEVLLKEKSKDELLTRKPLITKSLNQFIEDVNLKISVYNTIKKEDLRFQKQIGSLVLEEIIIFSDDPNSIAIPLALENQISKVLFIKYSGSAIHYRIIKMHDIYLLKEDIIDYPNQLLTKIDSYFHLVNKSNTNTIYREDDIPDHDHDCPYEGDEDDGDHNDNGSGGIPQDPFDCNSDDDYEFADAIDFIEQNLNFNSEQYEWITHCENRELAINIRDAVEAVGVNENSERVAKLFTDLDINGFNPEDDCYLIVNIVGLHLPVLPPAIQQSIPFWARDYCNMVIAVARDRQCSSGLPGFNCWFNAYYDVGKEAMLEHLVLISMELNSLLGDEVLPDTEEEWEAFGIIIIETVLRSGVDFIPIVGDIKGITDGIKAAVDERPGDAAFNITTGILGLIPITKTTSVGADVARFGYKIIKLINATKKIFKWISVGIKNGYKGFIKNGFFRLFKNGDEVGRIKEGERTLEILKNAGRELIDASELKKLDAHSINSGQSNTINSVISKENSIVLKATEPGLKNKVDDIVANGDNTWGLPGMWPGKKTEDLADDLFVQDGYTRLDGHYFGDAGRQGYDGVYLKGTLDNPEEIIINECKQWPMKLSGPGANAPSQMTDEWIEFVRQQILNDATNPRPQLAEIVRKALDPNFPNVKLTKTVTSVKRGSNIPANKIGEIVTVKID